MSVLRATMSTPEHRIMDRLPTHRTRSGPQTLALAQPNNIEKFQA